MKTVVLPDRSVLCADGHMKSSLFRWLFVCFCLALPFARAWGYHQLGPDRVLLMNNDTNIWNQVSYQGYNDTDQTKDTYWVHSAETGYGKASYLKPGITHTLYRNAGTGNQGDDTVLWHLQGCRAGSCTVDANNRNYLTWSLTSESILTTGDYDFSDVKGVGSVVMRNTTDAHLYSPYYADGIGTIYFDAVNSYTNTPGTLCLQIATNSLDETELSSTNYEHFAWMTCTVDVLNRKRRKKGGVFVESTELLPENQQD